jgi:flavin-dependent dehydrogenase
MNANNTGVVVGQAARVATDATVTGAKYAAHSAKLAAQGAKSFFSGIAAGFNASQRAESTQLRIK